MRPHPRGEITAKAKKWAVRDNLSGVDRALNKYQPMHRVNLACCSFLVGAGMVMCLYVSTWLMAVIFLVLVWVFQHTTDQLLMYQCLAWEYPRLPQNRRRQLYREYLDGTKS